LLACGQTGELLINVPSLFVFLSVHVPKGRTRYENCPLYGLYKQQAAYFKEIIILILFKTRNGSNLRYRFHFKYFTLYVATNEIKEDEIGATWARR
jgi:hypothetical protein